MIINYLAFFSFFLFFFFLFFFFVSFQLPKVGARFGITGGLLLAGGAELLFG